MKKIYLSLSIYLLLVGNANAVFVSGSTGTDGPFDPSAQPPQVPADTVINGNSVTVPLHADGVFNFSTVNIPSGFTVTFLKNAANTPVYILATGGVTVAGTIKVDGESASSSVPGAGGPGGYAGGYAGATNVPGGKGMGPGGGAPSTGPCGYYNFYNDGGAGGFGTAGGSWPGCGAGGVVYGNARLVPLIGGSGGGGASGFSTGVGGSGNGGGGGGAILVASSTTITVSGLITANGGNSYGQGRGGDGSGGAIKVVANVVTGNGSITAKGGGGDILGGAGRIRLEAYTNNRTAGTDPTYSYGLPSSVFVANLPSLSITSIAWTNVPASPTGSYVQPDIMLPSTTTNPVAVNVSASSIPVGTSVKVWVIPQYGSASSVDTILAGTQQSSTASANVNLSTSYSNVVTAESTFTIVGMYYDGEEIDRVRVAATMGGRSETTYITKSGKEIKGEMLTALVVRK